MQNKLSFDKNVYKIPYKIEIKIKYHLKSSIH